LATDATKTSSPHALRSYGCNLPPPPSLFSPLSLIRDKAGASIVLGDIPSPHFLGSLLLSFFLSHHHLIFVIINLLFDHVTFKEGKVKVEYGQLSPHDNKED
jgi:hypothetical protein